MTVQMNDILECKGVEFVIAAADGEGLFLPSDYGLYPVPACTACWKGYLCCYGLSGVALSLETLYLGALPEKDRGTLVNGVGPVPVRDGMPFSLAYYDLSLHVAFTGKLTVAREYIHGRGGRLGVHAPWDFEEVRELAFKEGRLESCEDISPLMADIRKTE